jgi:hypothetical protein
MQKQAAAVQEAAMREPVLITYHDRPRLVVMSMEEFERLGGIPPAAADERAFVASLNRSQRDFLISYSRGQLSRREAMEAVGLDPSAVTEFARLMNSQDIPWPKADRRLAEDEAEKVLALLDEEISR